MAHLTIYSKENCPYCVRAKALLDRKGVIYDEIDVEAHPEARARMQADGGGRTVPQIFNGDRYIGDCDGMHDLDARGELDALLGIASAAQAASAGQAALTAQEGAPRAVLIIGSGPAGYTAAIYAARANLRPLLFTGMQPGGQLTITTDVENYPGFPDGVKGPELMELFRKQAARFGTEIVDESVDAVDLKATPKTVRVGDRTFTARAVIIATGATAKWLGLESEKRFMGKGVSACATCDGFFFRGEDIAVVGGGDTALEEALYLTNFGKSVTLIHRRDAFRASRIMQDRVLAHPKVRVLWDSVVEEVLGDEKKMTALKIRNVKTGAVEEKPFGGFFIAIGHQPNTSLFTGQLSLDAAGYLVLPDAGKTALSLPGVFAAGDVRDPHYRQAVTAAGMGCMAAIEAERWLTAQ